MIYSLCSNLLQSNRVFDVDVVVDLFRGKQLQLCVELRHPVLRQQTENIIIRLLLIDTLPARY